VQKTESFYTKKAPLVQGFKIVELVRTELSALNSQNEIR